MIQSMHMLAISLFLGLVLTGCSSLRYEDLLPTSPSQTPLGNGPRFEDRKPHPWDGHEPWLYPVHGTDVSKYQADIDWHTLRRNGIAFAFIKATEGGDRIDDYFHRNWKAAREAGIARSAYHFFYFCRPAIEQARWFISHVPRDPSALPPVLDMEWNHLSPSCKLRPPAATVRAEMQVFLNALERHYGKRPIIYTTIDFFDKNGLSHFKDYQFWLRSVAAHPDELYGKHPWTFWQYTGTGILPGIKGDADINVFNGTASAWQIWLKAHTR